MRIKLFKNKEQKKRIERWCGRQWFQFLKFATRFLTLKRTVVFGRILGRLGFYLVARHRKMALRNVKLVYGKEKSPSELRELVQRTFINASCFTCETLFLYARILNGKKPEDPIKRIEGLEHLKAASSRGNGVIGLAAHLGNFPFISRKLDSLGFPNTVLMRQMRDQKLEGKFNIMRRDFGQNWIPKFPLSEAIKKCIAWLKTGKLFMIYIDQRSGQGVKINFMGVPTPTPTGAAVFALKTGAAVLPIVNVKEKDGNYKLIIGEEVPVVKTGDYKKDVLANTIRFNQVIEKYIRLYPDQWFWFHNRWKGVNEN